MYHKAPIVNLRFPTCDLCGGHDAELLLTTPRLNGPLVRCRSCQLCYIILPEQKPAHTDDHKGSQPIAVEMARLAQRARELALVEPNVEQSEQPWRELMAAERLADLRRFVAQGRLLEIGCATGEMLLAARASFAVAGVEADEGNSRTAQARGLSCFNGTLHAAQFADASFDVAALYHVIEHVPSPRAELQELRRVLKPGGWLVLETPNIATPWFRLLGARWRQFIPDHLFFFTPSTLTRLCEEHGFAVRELRSVGKTMSARLFISRLGRYHQPTAQALTRVSRRLRLDDRTLRLNLGDVMRLYAQRR